MTRLGSNGERTWSVEQWMTAEKFEEMRADGAKPGNAGAVGAVITRVDPATGKTGYFIDRPKDPDTGEETTGKFEIIGGADAANAAREAADSKFKDNRALASLQAMMASKDFVMPGEPGKEAIGLTFDQVFGPKRDTQRDGGLHMRGRVFFFGEHLDGRAPKIPGTLDALHPLEALAQKPEKVVMKLYLGDKELPRDRFPTLQSLVASEENAAFKTLTVSPQGAMAMIKNARDLERSELRRGWIEVKLNSFGFARDEKGQISQLYRTKDDFNAQWKAYENAERDLKAAERDLVSAKAEEAARTSEGEDAKASAGRQSLTYQVAQARLREALRAGMIESGIDERSPSFKGELDRRVAEPKLSKIRRRRARRASRRSRTRMTPTPRSSRRWTPPPRSSPMPLRSSSSPKPEPLTRTRRSRTSLSPGSAAATRGIRPPGPCTAPPT